MSVVMLCGVTTDNKE